MFCCFYGSSGRSLYFILLNNFKRYHSYYRLKLKPCQRVGHFTKLQLIAWLMESPLLVLLQLLQKIAWCFKQKSSRKYEVVVCSANFFNLKQIQGVALIGAWTAWLEWCAVETKIKHKKLNDAYHGDPIDID